MEEEKHIALTERMDRYAKGLMSSEEQADFEAELNADQELRSAFESFLLARTMVLRDGLEKEKEALKSQK